MPHRTTLASVLLATSLIACGTSNDDGTRTTSGAAAEGRAPGREDTGSVCDEGRISVILEGLEEDGARDYRAAVVSAIARDRARYHEACLDVAPGTAMPESIVAVSLISCVPNSSGQGFTVSVELCCLEGDAPAEEEIPTLADAEPWGLERESLWVTAGQADCGPATARAWALSIHYPNAGTEEEAAERAESRLDSAHYARSCSWVAYSGSKGKALGAVTVGVRSAEPSSGFLVDVELCCEAAPRSARSVAAQEAAAVEGKDAFDAARRGNLEDLIAHLARDPAAVERKADDGSTLLHRASRYQLACLLVLHGADVDARDKHGGSPLHYVAFTGDEQTAALLLAEGADINARDVARATPLFRSTRPKMAAWLLDHGADIGAQDLAGTTALHLAVVRKRPELVRLLLERGADPALADSTGKTALDLAKTPELRTLLQH